MSSSTLPLTSTLAELYHAFKDLSSIDLKTINTEAELDVPTPPVGQSISGRYKYEVLDKHGSVYNSGDWKPNLILNCGLDKLSEMPIAQVFQFAVAGKDPRPTKEPHVESKLSVRLLSSNNCPPIKWTGTDCDREQTNGALIARACEGNQRTAPDHALGGTCRDKAFGAAYDNGKLLYLPEIDQQYNIVESCPVYSIPPEMPEIYIQADCSSTLSGAIIPGGVPTDGSIQNTGLIVGTPGTGYMASLSHDTGLPWNEPGGLILKRRNFDLPSGDCSVPLLCTYMVSSYHTQNYDEWLILSGGDYYNTGAGISIEPPNMKYPDLYATAGGCGIQDDEITINDPGEGLPYHDPAIPESCPPVEIAFNIPTNPNCRYGDWQQYKSINIPGYARGLPANFQGSIREAMEGNINLHNIVRVGSHQMSMFGWPDFRPGLAGWMDTDSCSSFEEFFSKIFVFMMYRPPYDQLDLPTGSVCGPKTSTTIPGSHNNTCEGNYHSMGIDMYQIQDSIPALPGGGTPEYNGTWGATPNHVGQPDSSWSLEHYLPYWVHNSLSNYDTGTTSGGKLYMDSFSSWNTFKTNILDVAQSTAQSNPLFTTNLFSGIPIKALNCPDYTYVMTGKELDVGCGLLSAAPTQWATKSGMLISRGNSNPSFNNTASNPSYGPRSMGFPHIANTSVSPEPQWIEHNIVDGKLDSITFRWSQFYDWLTDVDNQHGHIIDFYNDDSMILGWGISPPSLVYELPRAARGVGQIDPSNGSLNGVEITDPGVGYCPGDIVSGRMTGLPTPRMATLSASTSPVDGSIVAIEVIDPGAGYSSSKPAKVCFPTPPEPDIISYDLVLDPVNTYESVNNGHWHEQSNRLPTPRCYAADIFETNQTYLYDQNKTHGWYLTGVNPGTNTTNCGTDFLSTANQIAMTRTFDFYMELQPTTYAEIGFKESPAACELWSRIALDPPIKLCPGQHLRLAYQLVVTFEPGPVPRYKQVPTTKDWYNMITVDGQYYLSGYECIQGLGIAMVDQYGIAVPYDITGLANEPYAPGTINLGPQYGYVNRWKNGDTRLSWPTKEYKTDLENPWLLGGDQHNPPDWAIKFRENPTVNYMPRSFKSYQEWDAQIVSTIDIGASASPWEPKLPVLMELGAPAGPELTFERDAFDHWFTKAPPIQDSTITWTQFVPNALSGQGRWDFLITKGYLADIYPQLMDSSTVIQSIRDNDWIEKYRDGQSMPLGGPVAYSNPGVFPGPVIPYDGQEGALHDPVSVKGNLLSRNGAALMYPYCDRYAIMMNIPNNSGPVCWPEIEYELRTCDRSDGLPVAGNPLEEDDSTITYKSCAWCPQDYAPYMDNVFDRPWGLTQRQVYLGYGNLGPPLSGTNETTSPRKVDENAGGGFSTIESWAPWTHTPLLTSIDQWSLIGDQRMPLRPDTAGNWSQAEAIPVCGASGFVSTSDEDFASYGSWVNRSHTLSGAVASSTNRPINDYTGTLSMEVPTYLEPYRYSTHDRAGDHCVKKHAIFDTNYANLTGIKCIGIGPTSTTLMPEVMTDAARFNTYVFKMGQPHTPSDYRGLDKLMAYKLDVTFQHTFYRNLRN